MYLIDFNVATFGKNIAIMNHSLTGFAVKGLYFKNNVVFLWNSIGICC